MAIRLCISRASTCRRAIAASLRRSQSGLITKLAQAPRPLPSCASLRGPLLRNVAGRRWFAAAAADSSGRTWITGEGAATPEAISSAQQKVQHCGGKILPRDPECPPFVREKSFPAAEWDSACARLGREMALTEAEITDLAQASSNEQLQYRHSLNTQDGRIHATRHVAYQTVRSKEKIHCIYGRFDTAVETEAPPEQMIPSEHVMECNGRMYAVFPAKSKDEKTADHDMMDHWIDIPSGWSCADLVRDDLKRVVNQVIAPHSWGADWVIVRQGSKWVAWHTNIFGYRSGERGASHVDWFQTDNTSRRCVFRGWPARLLIVQVPTSDLLTAWEARVPVAAQAAWSAALGMEAKSKAAPKAYISLAERAQMISMKSPELSAPSHLPPGLEDQDENPYEMEDGDDGMVV